MNSMGAIDGYFTGLVNGQTTAAASEAVRLNYRPMENRQILARIETRLRDLGISAQDASKRAGGSPDMIRNLRRAVREGRPTKLNATSLEVLSRVLEVSFQWLATGQEADPPSRAGIQLVGIVGAGSSVVAVDGADSLDISEEIGPLTAENTIALQVRGESQYPRFLDGEIVLVDKEPTIPDLLIGEYAAVETADGRMLIKIIQRGSRPTLFTLESHNAPPEHDVKIIGARRYKATLRSRPHVLTRRRRA